MLYVNSDPFHLWMLDLQEMILVKWSRIWLPTSIVPCPGRLPHHHFLAEIFLQISNQHHIQMGSLRTLRMNQWRIFHEPLEYNLHLD